MADPPAKPKDDKTPQEPVDFGGGPGVRREKLSKDPRVDNSRREKTKEAPPQQQPPRKAPKKA